ncbi:MAG: ferrous iron transport protein B [Clostridiales bacterium]|nr:ferrous iron transport protein B [Clostridiales bacterium]
MNILLVGNPNCGKTTLFNRLTGARARVSNRMGVTVDLASRRVRGLDAVLTDLPGLYSLRGSGGADEGLAAVQILRGCQRGCQGEGCQGDGSPDTAVSERTVPADTDTLDQKPELILNIVDATNLGRNLRLTTQLMELGLPMILTLNMMDECKAKGIVIDPAALQAALGLPVVPISARFGQGIPELLAQIRAGGTVPRPMRRGQAPALPLYREAAPKPDRILERPVLGLLVFAAVMGLVFTLTFDTLGAWLSDGMGALMEHWLIGPTALRLARAPAWLSGLLVDGLLRGIAGVLAFLPQVALLFGQLTILEDAGYLSRVSFLMDGLLAKIGLNGKAFVPLLMGFGCTVPALLATRVMDCPRERKRAALLLPYLSCSAKLPVYGLLARCFFPAHRGLVVLSLYALGIAVGVLVLLVTKHIQKDGDDAPFLMELPPYRRPALKNAWIQIADRTGHFLWRAGTVILLMSVLIWATLHFTPRLIYTEQMQTSLAHALGERLAPLLKPLGFGTAAAAVALLTGLVAKEAVVATLLLFYGTEAALTQAFTPLSAYCFLVFVLLYPPCFAALATLRRETRSFRFTLTVIFLQFMLAYGIASLIQIIGNKQ